MKVLYKILLSICSEPIKLITDTDNIKFEKNVLIVFSCPNNMFDKYIQSFKKYEEKLFLLIQPKKKEFIKKNYPRFCGKIILFNDEIEFKIDESFESISSKVKENSIGSCVVLLNNFYGEYYTGIKLLMLRLKIKKIFLMNPLVNFYRYNEINYYTGLLRRYIRDFVYCII